ncbi:MAG TPA: bacterial proteasome activator family protein [Acidimicrobiales bacterium]|nr:bacterial proteasome activator family protein [Acidimicrobiales bacterium]
MAQDTDGAQDSDGNSGGREATPAEQVVLLAAQESEQNDGQHSDAIAEAVEEPAKVMRIGSMIKQLLDEVRQAPLDEKSRDRVRDVFEQSVKELAEGLSPDLREELGRLTLPFDADTPSDAELRVAQAQLVGWLEGLFHGIQATLFAQQMAARAQLEQMRQKGLPAPAEDGQARRSTYL